MWGPSSHSSLLQRLILTFTHRHLVVVSVLQWYDWGKGGYRGTLLNVDWSFGILFALVCAWLWPACLINFVCGRYCRACVFVVKQSLSDSYNYTKIYIKRVSIYFEEMQGNIFFILHIGPVDEAQFHVWPIFILRLNKSCRIFRCCVVSW